MERPAHWWTPVLALALLAGCAGEPAQDPRPVVVTSVLPYRFVVDRIAGDLVRTEVMLPPGANPSTYAPSVRQLQALEQAALYVKVGHPRFPFEAAWLDRLLSATPGRPVVDGSAGVDSNRGDPHVWVAPRNLERTAVQVEAALAEILPAHRETLRANLETLRDEIASLDDEIRATLAGATGERFLVFHPAWGYFAEAYGLEQISIEHDHKHPGAHELLELIERARKEQVTVVYIQPQFDPSSAEALAREIGARVETLDPLAYDWDANLRRVARALAEGFAG
jgi:zinc transport system substrate-binding protein